MKHVVQFSGGVGSWGAARRVVDTYGAENTVLLFADVLMEDEDLYRFIKEASSDLGVPITRISREMTPWDIFNKERFLGNSRIDPCSKFLKRVPLREWIEQNCKPINTIVYLGIDWTESHRLDKAVDRWLPWRVCAPLCDPPYVSKNDLLADLKRRGIKPPRLYAMGFAHNNCGGFCIKAGKGHFQTLLKAMPARFKYHELEEQAIREKLGDVSILREQRDGVKHRLTLKELRERIEAGEVVDKFDIGGCGCAID